MDFKYFNFWTILIKNSSVSSFLKLLKTFCFGEYFCQYASVVCAE